jgi:hypothetical protein
MAVFMKDPATPITDMQILIPPSGTPSGSPQNVVITSSIDIYYPTSPCPFTYTLTQMTPSTSDKLIPSRLESTITLDPNLVSAGTFVAGTYAYNLTISPNPADPLRDLVFSFNVIIVDPCEIAIFEALPAPLLNMPIIETSSYIVTQNFAVKTNV